METKCRTISSGQRRNSTLWRVSGIHGNIRQLLEDKFALFTLREKQRLDNAADILTLIIEEWK